MAGHDIRVSVLLTAEEFLALSHMADEDGLSQSSFMRHLLRAESGVRAACLVSDLQRLADTPTPAQVLHK